MSKIIIIDGGPRKTMNTAKMIASFIEGARQTDSEVDIQHVRLYDLNYHGCASCLACKLKNSKHPTLCSKKDELSDLLAACQEADGLVFASPIYFNQITAQLHGLAERLFFPWLSYDSAETFAPKRVPTATIYTMGATEGYYPNVEPALNTFDAQIEHFLTKPERVTAIYTVQVKNYDRYAMGLMSQESKEKWQEEHWASDLKHAYDAGVNMIKAITQ